MNTSFKHQFQLDSKLTDIVIDTNSVDTWGAAIINLTLEG